MTGQSSELATESAVSNVGQRHQYVAVIAMAAAFGATFGLTTPLISLVMNTWGVSEFVIGANSAMPGVAALIFGFYFSRMIQVIGAQRMLLSCLSVVVVACIAFPALPDVGAWFVIRFGLGAAGMGLFIVSEYWINAIASPENRGRLIAIYTTAVAAGWMLGALLLSVVGSEGWLPFLAGAGLIGLAFVPILITRVATPPVGDEAPISLGLVMRCAPAATAAAIVSGVLYLGGASLLPVYAVNQGLTESETARCIAWLAAGQLCLPLVTGVLSDRFSNRHVLIGMALLGTVMFWNFSWLFQHGIWRPLSLFLLGGLTMGTYAVALTVLGHRFRGVQLAAAMASISIMFSLGEIAGPPLVGAAMDYLTDGFSLSLAAFMTVFLVLTLVDRQET